MKRLWWLLRLAFHDWMWEGRTFLADPADCGWPRALARKLPLYFSDPHALPWKGSTMTPVDIVTPPGGVKWIFDHPSGMCVEEPQRTWSTGSSLSFTTTWPLSPENPHR